MQRFARLEARGPMWRGYDSDFMKERRVTFIRTTWEIWRGKIANALKR